MVNQCSDSDTACYVYSYICTQVVSLEHLTHQLSQMLHDQGDKLVSAVDG